MGNGYLRFPIHYDLVRGGAEPLYRDSRVLVWDAQSGEPLSGPLERSNYVWLAQFSPDGKRILTVSYSVRVWDAQSGQPLTEPLKYDKNLTSAQFSPDGKRIVTASEDNTARVWDAASGQPLTEPLKYSRGMQSAGFIHNISAQFSPDGTRIVTASGDGTAQVWDAASGQPLTEPLRHGRRVHSAQFSPDGRRILTVSVGKDNTARVWDISPSPANYPVWLSQLAEAISGQVINKQGLLGPTHLDRAETINQIRQKLNQAPDNDDWVVWGRWLLADPSTRTISPFSKVTVPEYVEDQIKEGDTVSLEEAERLAVGNTQLLQRIAEARQNRPNSLQAEARALASQGKLAEAETRYREALAMQRKLLGNEHPDVANSRDDLVELLLRERKFDEAEQLFDDLLTPAAERQPKSAGLLSARGNLRARTGHWKEAAADFSRVVEFEPEDPEAYRLLAPLLVQSGDLEGYRRHCARIVARFGGTYDPVIAERMAKDCLILPSPGADLTTESNWANTAVTEGENHPYLAYFQFVKGLAEYRQGHFASAAEWTQKVLTQTGEVPFRDVEAYMVMAMAQHRSRQPDQARAALAKGVEIAETKLPKLDSGDLGDDWLDWIIAHALMSEAKALLGTQPATAERDSKQVVWSKNSDVPISDQNRGEVSGLWRSPEMWFPKVISAKGRDALLCVQADQPVGPTISEIYFENRLSLEDL